MKAADEDDYGEDEDEDDLFTLLTALRGILMTSIDTTGTQPGRPAWSDPPQTRTAKIQQLLHRRRVDSARWAAKERKARRRGQARGQGEESDSDPATRA